MCGFEVTDKITLTLQKNDLITAAISNFNSYICSETLAGSFTISDEILTDAEILELTDEIFVTLKVEKMC